MNFCVQQQMGTLGTLGTEIFQELTPGMDVTNAEAEVQFFRGIQQFRDPPMKI